MLLLLCTELMLTGLGGKGLLFGEGCASGMSTLPWLAGKGLLFGEGCASGMSTLPWLAGKGLLFGGGCAAGVLIFGRTVFSCVRTALSKGTRIVAGVFLAAWGSE